MNGARIDLHVHLAGLGHDGTGCRISSRMRRSLQYQALARLLALPRQHQDRAYVDRLIASVNSATEIDYACILALDGAYDAQGQFDPRHSHLYVPNDYVVAICSRSTRLLPVISINPQRHDALAELAHWGPQAVALKWLAPLQRFDPSAARYRDFIRLVHELDLPVISHSGTEHTFPGVVQQLGDPRLCTPLLDLGIPVIFAHCGTGSFWSPDADFTAAFEALLSRYDCAFGDTSGFVSIFRARQIERFAAERFRGRVFHGSDYPVPTSALYFLPALGWRGVRALERLSNPLDKDIAIKRTLGLPAAAFTGAYELLAKRIATVKGLAGC